jgi:hypothetical protein
MESRGELDRSLDALGHKYRRRLLLALSRHNPQDDEDAQDAEEALKAVFEGTTENDMIETELIHSHLPKLERYEYIIWDQETGAISKGPNWEEIEPILSLLESHRDELPEEWI